jgi:putative copper resistance protein D
VLLVLGHPVTLATRVVRPRTAARWADLRDSPVVALTGHPLVAWGAVGLTLFGLYPTGLYAAIVPQHWAHLTMNAAFLLTGLTLFRAVLGLDLGRRSLPPIGQLVLVFAVMALHAGFAAWLLGRPDVVAAGYYGALRLPFVPDPLADQRLGALLGWGLGEAPVILAVLVLVRRWGGEDGSGPGEPGTTSGADPSSPGPAGAAPVNPGGPPGSRPARPAPRVDPPRAGSGRPAGRPR